MEWISVYEKLPTLENLPDDYSHFSYYYNGNTEEEMGAYVFVKLIYENDIIYERCYFEFMSNTFIDPRCQINFNNKVQKWTLLPQKDII